MIGYTRFESRFHRQILFLLHFNLCVLLTQDCVISNIEHSLNCAYQGMTSFPDAILPNVTHLDLSWNQIASFPVEGSAECVAVRPIVTLDVSNNALSGRVTIDVTCFMSLKSLKISNNKLTDLPVFTGEIFYLLLKWRGDTRDLTFMFWFIANNCAFVVISLSNNTS